MSANCDIKALFVIVNAGFSTEVTDIARSAGAKGATILNARGESGLYKPVMGITVDTEKEILLMLIEANIADAVMLAIKEHAGLKTPAHSVCFTLPVERTTDINTFINPHERK